MWLESSGPEIVVQKMPKCLVTLELVWSSKTVMSVKFLVTFGGSSLLKVRSHWESYQSYSKTDLLYWSQQANPKYGPKSELGANMYTYLKFGLPRVLPPRPQSGSGGPREPVSTVKIRQGRPVVSKCASRAVILSSNQCSHIFKIGLLFLTFNYFLLLFVVSRY